MNTGNYFECFIAFEQTFYLFKKILFNTIRPGIQAAREFTFNVRLVFKSNNGIANQKLLFLDTELKKLFLHWP